LIEIMGETVNIHTILRPSPCDNRQAPPLAERLERIMPDLPSGTVTFLFTDIEGSTALWERDRAAMHTAVARHIALLNRRSGSTRVFI
jgi:class 3 adenylate cyclase